MEIIKLEAITKIYGEKLNRVKALDNIHLTINKGEFIAVVGESGSGKSTLLSIIGGLNKPTIGNVIFNNRDYNDLTSSEMCDIRRNDISFIYQFYNLISTLTVKENIILPLLLDNKSVDEDKLNELLTKLKLDNRENFYINDLSGGQKQKVAVIRALINNPQLILADEPTGNLDTTSANEVINFLKEYNNKFNTTVIIVTHNLEIAKICDRIIKLKDGRIIKDEKNI